MENNFDEHTQMVSSSTLSGGVNNQSSILMPTIPIFHLQKSPSETISLIKGGTQTTQSVMCTGNDLLNRSATNTNSFLNIDVSSDVECNADARGSFNCGSNAADLNIDWSNSLFRPASRFSVSNRRECKSTSDETHIFELNCNAQSNRTSDIKALSVKKPNFFISPNYNSSTSSTSSHMQLTPNNSSSRQRPFKGQFGFNPNSLKLLNSKLSLNNSSINANTNSNNLNEKLASCSFKFTSVSNKDKKSVKRLTGNTKFSIDSMSKKHHDFTHNKKLFHAVSNNDYKTGKKIIDYS